MTKLGWKIYEQHGIPVLNAKDPTVFIKWEEACNNNSRESFYKNNSFELNVLKVGDKVGVANFIGYVSAKVTKLSHKDKKGEAESSSCLYLLNFCEKRNMWVSGCQISKSIYKATVDIP